MGYGKLAILATALLLLGSSCNRLQGGTGGANQDASGISTLSLRLTSGGDLEWTVQGEPGLYVFRLGQVLRAVPQDDRLFIMGGIPFFALGSQGEFEAYLRRDRDGRWVKGSIPYAFALREDGTGEFRTLSPARFAPVPTEADLPFYLGTANPPGGRPYNKPWLKEPPASPLVLGVPVCLQRGASWPYGQRPGNTSPDFPPVAPEAPPALMTFWYSPGGGHAMIEYLQGRYVRAIDALNSYSLIYYSADAYAPPPGESMEVKDVIFTVIYEPTHPLRNRWTRIYPREPFRLRWEGDRLVCEGFGEWVAELMPEGFTIPGYNYDTGVFEMNKGVPMVLPPEWDPYAGR